MKIYLIRDVAFEQEIFDEIYLFLKSTTGELKFIISDEQIETITPSSHDSYFERCNKFRKENKIKKSDIVIFLSTTSYSNYFSLPDFKNNIYVKVSGWENYVDSQIRYPISIEIATNIFHLLMFKSETDVQQKTHMNEDRGCLNDYHLKTDGVVKKLKTTDLCDDCLKLLNPYIISPNIVEQIFEIADKGSVALKKVKRYLNTFDALELQIKDNHTKLYFQEPLNHALPLSPIQMTLYKYLLLNEEGVKAQHLFDIKKELFDIYFVGKISTQNKEDSETSIENLCLNASTPVSNINAKLTQALPSSIAEQYKIQNINGTYIITVDRKLVKGL